MTAISSPRIGEKRELSPPAEEFVEKKARSQSPDIRHGDATKPTTESRQERQKQKKGGKKRLRKLMNIEPCSHDDVHWHEVCELLGQETVNEAAEEESLFDSPFEFKEEVELQISRLSSNGGLLFCF